MLILWAIVSFLSLRIFGRLHHGCGTFVLALATRFFNHRVGQFVHAFFGDGFYIRMINPFHMLFLDLGH